MLEESGARYCVIGGMAMLAYVDDASSTFDLDIVVAVEDLDRVRALLSREFRTEQFQHSFNVYDPGSKVQVQIQLDPGLDPVVDRAERREIIDLVLPIAHPADLLDLKVAAAMEPRRRPSKRGKDLIALGQLLRAFPELRDRVPATLMPEIERVMDPVDE